MKKIIFIFILLIVLASALNLTSCKGDKDKVIILINDYKIYESELNRHKANYPEASEDQLIENIIMLNILYLEALSLDLDKDPKIQQKLENQKRNINFQIFYEDQIKNKVVITEEDIREEFEKNKYRFQDPDYDSMRDFFKNKVQRNKEEELISKFSEVARNNYKIEKKEELLSDERWKEVKDNLVVIVVINETEEIISNELAAEIRYMKGIDRYYKESYESRVKLLDKVIDRRIFLLEGAKEDYSKTIRYKKKYDKYLKDQLINHMIYVHIPLKLMLTEEDLRAHYTSNKQRYYIPEQIHVQHILFDTELPAIETLKKIKSSKDPVDEFKKNALKFARGPDSVKSLAGDLGFIQRGVMPDEFDDVAFSLGINEIGGPVKTEYGYHLVLMLERKAETQIEYDSVKNQIYRELFNQKKETMTEEYYESIKKNYKVKILYKKKEVKENDSKKEI